MSSPNYSPNYFTHGMDIELSDTDNSVTPTIVRDDLTDDMLCEDIETEQEVGFVIDRTPSTNPIATNIIEYTDTLTDITNENERGINNISDSDSDSEYEDIDTDIDTDIDEGLEDDLNVVENMLNINQDHEEDDYIGIALFARAAGRQARHYCRQNNMEMALNKYLEAMSYNPFVEFNNELATLYEENGELEKAKYYYLQAIEYSDDILAMYNLADMFKKDMNHLDKTRADHATKMMLKYYAMAAEKGDHEALEMLCALAYEKDAAKFSMAYKEILQHSEDHFDWNKDADDDYSEDGEDKLLYGRFMRNTNNIQILKTLENADTANMSETEKKTIRECIDLLNRERSVITYNNKVALFTRLNNVVECGICYDDKLNIDLHCGHCVCTDCYPRIVHNSCPFCRIESPCGFFD